MRGLRRKPSQPDAAAAPEPVSKPAVILDTFAACKSKMQSAMQQCNNTATVTKVSVQYTSSATLHIMISPCSVQLHVWPCPALPRTQRQDQAQHDTAHGSTKENRHLKLVILVHEESGAENSWVAAHCTLDSTVLQVRLPLHHFLHSKICVA